MQGGNKRVLQVTDMVLGTGQQSGDGGNVAFTDHAGQVRGRRQVTALETGQQRRRDSRDLAGRGQLQQRVRVLGCLQGGNQVAGKVALEGLQRSKGSGRKRIIGRSELAQEDLAQRFAADLAGRGDRRHLHGVGKRSGLLAGPVQHAGQQPGSR